MGKYDAWLNDKYRGEIIHYNLKFGNCSIRDMYIKQLKIYIKSLNNNNYGIVGIAHSQKQDWLHIFNYELQYKIELERLKKLEMV